MAEIRMWRLPHTGKVQVNSGKKSIKELWILDGTDDRVEAEAFIDSNPDVETTIEFLPIQSKSIKIFEDHTDLWSVEIIYASGDANDDPTDPIEIGNETVSFSTKGGTARITQATRHVADYGQSPADIGLPPADPPNHRGAINVNRDGEAEGVDVEIPGLVYSVRKIMAATEVTGQYLQTLKQLTKKVNDSTWRGFPAGEVWFRGVDGGPRDAESYDLTFEFVISETLEDYDLDTVEGISKGGHEYAWGEYEEVVNEAADPPSKASRLLAVHIEEIYPPANFSLLGISS